MSKSDPHDPLIIEKGYEYHIQDLMNLLNTDLEKGLSQEEAHLRIQRVGKNEILISYAIILAISVLLIYFTYYRNDNLFTNFNEGGIASEINFRDFNLNDPNNQLLPEH